jgi:integrase
MGDSLMGRVDKDVADFIESRKSEGYALATLRNYTYNLNRLIRHAGSRNTGTITTSDIDQVFAAAVQDLTSASMNNLQACLQAFFKWCRQRGRISRDHDPLAGRRFRKVIPMEKRRVPVGQFPALLDAAVNPRDRMIVALGLFLLLRQSEIADLRIGDVNLESGQITARIFKTKDMDVMPISRELDVELRRWLTLYAEQCGPLQHHWFLAPSRRFTGEDWGPGGVLPNRLGRLLPETRCPHVVGAVQRALKGIGWEMRRPDGKPEWHGAHVLRRSAARAIFDELAAEGYDGALRTVQSFLHHASSQMTERYLGLEVDRAIRDKKYQGAAMFPSLSAGNVVRLEVAHNGEADDYAV